jgi:hypothetical protein
LALIGLSSFSRLCYAVQVSIRVHKAAVCDRLEISM